MATTNADHMGCSDFLVRRGLGALLPIIDPRSTSAVHRIEQVGLTQNTCRSPIPRVSGICYTVFSRDGGIFYICWNTLCSRIVSYFYLGQSWSDECLRRWYKSAELGKRSGIFTSSGFVGTL